MWLYNPEAYAQGAQADTVGWLTRGVAYWSDGRDDERILMGTLDGYLLALNAKTRHGRSPTFGESGKADLTAANPRAKRGALHQFDGERHYLSVDSPPVVVRDTVIVGSSMSDRPPVQRVGARRRAGVRRAHRQVEVGVPRDSPRRRVRRRHLEGRLESLHRQRQRLVDDERRRRARATSTCRRRRRTATTTAGFRKGDGLFAEILVAVTSRPASASGTSRPCITASGITTFPRAPTLLDITVDGRRIKALAQVSKQAFTYVFDRVTGTAGVADRRAAGAAVGHSRRGAVADAAVPDEAAGLRSAGHHRERSDRLHAGAARRGARRS